ncbi:MAG: trypsin-like peptidase domain-containing protein [Phycisphaerales bacterium]|jgi:serine protease Do|nr:trypsin-like peptidase domain-containing protein [Phycisphaerales bacterium]
MRTPSIVVACLISLMASIAFADDVVLHSGARLQGTILKRTDQKLWLDVGPTVLVLDMADVSDVVSKEPMESTIAVRQGDLFSTAEDLPELTPREHAKRIGPAVIKVSTPGGLGSGVIINEDGSAITNAHVVQGETALRATVWFPQPDGTLKRTLIDDVELVAVNSHLDLALIRIKHPEGKPFNIATVEIEDEIEGGQPVFAIGNPLGLERTLTQGVVSTRNRPFDGLSYIQTDTPINPGNSGGPLFNSRGEVIGITNMIIGGGQSLGFAIPSRYMKDFVRNREAFAYNKDNPNSGRRYHQPPRRRNFEDPPQLQDGTSASD